MARANGCLAHAGAHHSKLFGPCTATWDPQVKAPLLFAFVSSDAIMSSNGPHPIWPLHFLSCPKSYKFLSLLVQGHLSSFPPLFVAPQRGIQIPRLLNFLFLSLAFLLLILRALLGIVVPWNALILREFILGLFASSLRILSGKI